jgi:Fe-S-cluster containining protein
MKDRADRGRQQRQRRGRMRDIAEAGRSATTGADMLAGVLAHAPGRNPLERRIGRQLTAPPTVTPAQEEALRALWATLPDVECLGQCWDACGPIRMTTPEHALTERAGFDIPDAAHNGNAYLCPALTMLKQCAVYDVRPMICRLWGVSEHMPCNYGCRPAGRPLLSIRETWEAIAEGFRIAGDTDGADKILAAWSTPERAAETDRLITEKKERDDEQRQVQMLRAQRRGGITYVQGPGQLGKKPAQGTQQ